MNKKVSILLLALALILAIILILAGSITPKHDLTEELKATAEQLILVNYNNNYQEIINSLPNIVTEDAKALLSAKVADNYSSRAPYDTIKDLEIVLYDQTGVKGKNNVTVVSKYRELQLFNSAMTTITVFTIQKGHVIEIETHDYTDSVSVDID